LPGGITLYLALDESELIGHIQNIMLLHCVKIWGNWCKKFTEVDIHIQWPCTILQVKNWVFDFIARWHYLCYKFVQYRVDRCIPNKIMLKSTKNHANWLIRFEDNERSKHSGLVFWTIMYVQCPAVYLQ